MKPATVKLLIAAVFGVFILVGFVFVLPRLTIFSQPIQTRNNLPPGLPQAAVNAATELLGKPNHKAMCIAWDRQSGRSGWGTDFASSTQQEAVNAAMAACGNSRMQYQVQSSCAVLVSDDNVVLTR